MCGYVLILYCGGPRCWVLRRACPVLRWGDLLTALVSPDRLTILKTWATHCYQPYVIITYTLVNIHGSHYDRAPAVIAGIVVLFGEDAVNQLLVDCIPAASNLGPYGPQLTAEHIRKASCVEAVRFSPKNK